MTDLRPVILSETEVRSSLTREDALKAVRDAFVAATAGHARNFPVVREKLTGRVFGIKSAVDEARKILGFKAGGAFPSNLANGASAHQSSVMLIDFETGQVRAIVSGNAITAQNGCGQRSFDRSPGPTGRSQPWRRGRRSPSRGAYPRRFGPPQVRGGPHLEPLTRARRASCRSLQGCL